MAFDIITVGSTTQDVFVDTKDRLFHGAGRKESVCVNFGTKIIVENLSFGIGGGAFNTAVNFKKMGMNTSILSVVGDDIVKDSIKNILSKLKIDSSMIISKKGYSSYSIVLDSLGHERTILAYKGVNDNLNFSDVDLKKFSNVKCVYFSTMLGESFNTVSKLIKMMHEKNIITVFNPSIYLANQGIKKLKNILKYTSLLIFNKEEAYSMVKNNDANKLNDLQDIIEAVRKIHSYGPQNIVVTDGANEIVGFDGQNFYRVKPPSTKVVETTGAGDAFASTFTTAFMKGYSFELCLCAGIVQSQNVISDIGSTSNLESWPDVLSKAKKIIGIVSRL